MFLSNLYFSVYKTLGDPLRASRGSLLDEMSHILHYVQDKFSEVLIPKDRITKQGLIGKGC